MSSPVLSQMKLRSFYEQHGQRVARPLTMIDEKVVEGFNCSRNSPALEFKNKDMLKIE
jgi:hypothetical protein